MQHQSFQTFLSSISAMATGTLIAMPLYAMELVPSFFHGTDI
jgi:hypothetical protein